MQNYTGAPHATSRRLAPAGMRRPASSAVLLARNGYITGQTISVNGGMYFAA